MDYYNERLKELVGKTLSSVINNGNEINFEATTGEKWKMSHDQDCCESVILEDVCGDLEDLVGSPILMAEVSTNSDKSKEDRGYEPDSFTWTFYKLATVKGYVTLRWYGTSNGYYSETCSFWPCK